MKFIKRHLGSIIGLIILVLMIVAFFKVKNIFNPDESTAIYGTRLEGREKVKISKKTKENVKKNLEERTESFSIRIAGNIINISIKVKEDVSLDEAKNLGNKAVEGFSEEEKKYYDIQIFIQNEKNANQFPIIGYKHQNKGAISWTKDRAAG